MLFVSCVFHTFASVHCIWSPAGKGLTSWLLLGMFIAFLLLCHVVSLLRCVTDCIVPDLCLLPYFKYITSPLIVTLLHWMRTVFCISVITLMPDLGSES